MTIQFHPKIGQGGWFRRPFMWFLSTKRPVLQIPMLLLLMCWFSNDCFANSADRGVVLTQEASSTGAKPAVGETLRVAIVIGIDHYQFFPKLKYAVSDAEAFAEVLKSKELGGYDHVEFLKDKSYEEIHQTLLKWGAKLNADSTLVVYFAGHGILGEGTLSTTGVTHKRGCGEVEKRGQRTRDEPTLLLLTRESRPECPTAAALSLDELRIFFETLPVRRKLLIVDACFNGSGRSVSPVVRKLGEKCKKGDCTAQPLIDVALSRVNRGLSEQSHALLLAARPDTAAQEHKDLGHGIYTYFLLKALCEGHPGIEACSLPEPSTALLEGCKLKLPKHAAALNALYADPPDTDGDSALSAYEVHDYATTWTMCMTKNQQIPMGAFQQVGTHDVFLSGAPTGTPVATINGLSLDTPEGTTIAIDQQVKRPLPRVIPVEPGEHEVAIWDLQGKRSRYGIVKFRPGESFNLTQLENAIRGYKSLIEVQLGTAFQPGDTGIGRATMTLSSSRLRVGSPTPRGSLGMFVTVQGGAFDELPTRGLVSGLLSFNALSAGLEAIWRSEDMPLRFGFGFQAGFKQTFSRDMHFPISVISWQGVKVNSDVSVTLRTSATVERGEQEEWNFQFALQPGLEWRR